MSSFQARDAKIRAHGEEETSRSIKRLGTGTSFKARPVPKRTRTATPAAMKVKRATEEKQRQHFRRKVELFYNSKPELQCKWEKARVTLLIKYSSGLQWKLFETKLVEKYGKEFQHFKASAESNRFFESSQESNVDGRVPCSYCGRKFVVDRVFKHENICVRTKGKKGDNIHLKNHEAREKIRIQRIREKERTGVRSKKCAAPARFLKPKHVVGKKKSGAGSGLKAALLLQQKHKSSPIDQQKPTIASPPMERSVPTDPRLELDVGDGSNNESSEIPAVDSPRLVSSPPFTCHVTSLQSPPSPVKSPPFPVSPPLMEMVDSFVNQWYVATCKVIFQNEFKNNNKINK